MFTSSSHFTGAKIRFFLLGGSEGWADVKEEGSGNEAVGGSENEAKF